MSFRPTGRFVRLRSQGRDFCKVILQIPGLFRRLEINRESPAASYSVFLNKPYQLIIIVIIIVPIIDMKRKSDLEQEELF